MHMFTYSNTLPKMENNLDTWEMYTARIKVIFPIITNLATIWFTKD